MLDDVGEDNRVGILRQTLDGLEVRDDRLVEASAQIADPIGVIFESDSTPEMIAHCFTVLSARCAEIEQNAAARRETAEQIDEDPMTASVEVFECVDVRHCEVGKLGSWEVRKLESEWGKSEVAVFPTS